MPIARVQLPDGRIARLDVSEGTTPEEVEAFVASQFVRTPAAAPAVPEPERQSTIAGELVRGGKQLYSSARTAVESLFGTPEEAARAGIERGKAISEEAGEGPSFEALKRAYEERGLWSAAGEAASQIPRALAGQGAQLGAMYAAGKLGAAAGAPFGGPVGAGIGAAVGAGSVLVPSLFGANVERQAKEQAERGEPVSIDVGAAGLGAAGQAALEAAGTGFTLGKRVVKGILGIADDAALASAKASDDLVKMAGRTLAGGVVRGAAVEMPVEIAQSVIERAQAGLDLTSDEALKEYGEAAYLAGLVGGPLGGVGRAVERSGARNELARQAEEERRVAAQEAAVAQAEQDAIQAQEQEQQALIEEQNRRMARLPEGGQGTLFRGAEIPRMPPPAPSAPLAPEAPNIVDVETELFDLRDRRDRVQAYQEQAQQAGDVIGVEEAQKVLNILNRQIRPLQKQYEILINATDRAAQQTFDFTPPPPTTAYTKQGELDFGPPPAPTPEQPPMVEPTVRKRVRKGTQLGLFEPPIAEPTSAAPTVAEAPVAPEPRPGAITLDSVGKINPSLIPWFKKNIEGKTADEVRAMVEAQPDLVKGRSAKAQLIRTLIVPETPAYEGAPNVTVPPDVGVEPTTERETGQRGLELDIDAGGKQPAGVSTAPAAPEAPATTESGGLGAVEQPTVVRNVDEGPAAPAVEVGEAKPVETAPAETAPTAAAPAETAPTIKEPVVKKSEPPKDSNVSYAPTLTMDYGEYTIENDGSDIAYDFKEPKQLAPNATARRMSLDNKGEGITLNMTNAKGAQILVRVRPDYIELDSPSTGAYVRREFNEALVKPLEVLFGKDFIKQLDALPAQERVPYLQTHLFTKFGVENPSRFLKEFQSAYFESEGRPDGTKTPETVKTETQGRESEQAPTAPEVTEAEPEETPQQKALYKKAERAAAGEVWSQYAPENVKFTDLEEAGQDAWTAAVQAGKPTISTADYISDYYKRKAKPTAAAPTPAAPTPAAPTPKSPPAKKATAKAAPAAPAPKAKPAPAAYTEWLNKNGAVEVFRDGDLALVFRPVRGRGVDYLGVNVDTLENASVSSGFIHSLFTPEQLAVLSKQYDKAVAEDAANAAKYPDGPFTGATSNVVATKSVDPALANYIRALTQKLGMNHIRILMVSDFNDLNDPELRLYGDHTKAHYIKAAGPNPFGLKFAFGPKNKDFVIYTRKTLDKSQSVEVAAHELGHIIQNVAFDSAPKNVQDAVRADYDKWLAASKKLTPKGVVESIYPPNVPVNLTNVPADFVTYASSFKEWFANNVARWAITDKKATTLIEKFFKSVADKLKKLFRTLTADRYMPAQSMAEFLDKMGPDPDITPPTGVMPTINVDQLTGAQTQTDTPEFKGWFGSSKVVDENGKPLVVYHRPGTGIAGKTDFSAFRTEYKGKLRGAWFSTDPNYGDRLAYGVTEGENIMPVYLSVKKPLDLRVLGEASHGDVIQKLLDRAGVANSGSRFDESDFLPTYDVAKMVMEGAQKAGYDGIVLSEGADDVSWVAFRPEQIKSVYNRGTFDPNALEIDRLYVPDNITTSSELYEKPTAVTRAIRSMAGEAAAAEGESAATRFRTINVDASASVAKKISAAFDGKLRDATGRINPLPQLRQANDYGKLLISLFENGALVKDPNTGLYEARRVEGVPSAKDAFDVLAKWAKTNGISFTDAKNELSKMLEARRLDYFRRHPELGVPLHKLSNRDPRSADAQINAMLAKFNAEPQLKDVADMLRKMRERLVQQMYEVGRITQADRDLWIEAVEYIPFDRMEEFATKFKSSRRVGRGLASLGNLPEIIGSERRETQNVLDNQIRNFGWLTGQILNNDASQATLRTLERIGAAQYKGMNPNVTPERKVRVFMNGEEHFFELASRWDVKAFTALAMPKSWAVQQMGNFSNVLRTTVTALPPFALKQVTDDIQRAFVLSGVRNPYALILPALKKFLAVAWYEITGRRHPLVSQMGRKGVVGEYDFDYRDPSIAILQDFGYVKRPWFKELLHRMEGITRASDLAVRSAIYDRVMTETGDELLATNKAREFINFRRRGAGQLIGTATATIPFFNAYVQSMDLLYRNATGTDVQSAEGRGIAKRMFISQLAKLAAFAAIYALAVEDDDDYKGMGERIRANNWIIPGVGKLPMPNELAAITKVPVETLLEYLKRQGTKEEMEAADATTKVLKYAFEQFGGRVTPIPTAIRPVLEAITNYSFLGGRPLEGIYQRTLDPEQRTTPTTSELAKAIGQASKDLLGVGVSPIKIDNFLNQWFGSTSATVTMLADGVLNPDKMDRPLHKYFLLSTYMYDPVPGRGQAEAYELREKYGTKHNTLLKLSKEDPDAALKYAEDNQKELIYAKFANSIMEKYEQTRKFKAYLESGQAAKDMSQEERRNYTDEVRKMESEVGLQVRELKTMVNKDPTLR